MSTLTVDVNCLPNTYTNVGLEVDVWLGSAFIRQPSGQTQPPAGSPVASGTTDSSGDVSLTGLTTGTSYWVRVVDSMGYYHWFPTELESATLQANINMPPPVILANPPKEPSFVSAHVTGVVQSGFSSGLTVYPLDSGGVGNWLDSPFTFGTNGVEVGQAGRILITLCMSLSPHDSSSGDYPGQMGFEAYDATAAIPITNVVGNATWEAATSDVALVVNASGLYTATATSLIQVLVNPEGFGSLGEFTLQAMDLVFLGAT